MMIDRLLILHVDSQVGSLSLRGMLQRTLLMSEKISDCAALLQVMELKGAESRSTKTL